ncbi:MAG: DJ-1/PfpI family protein [Kiritimatiellae bacterium]|nr:DJ-1/PfpI family protein [Kiritimatiellia bacterium]
MANALVVLAEGFEDIEAVSVVDILRRGGVEVTTASLGGSQCVRSAHGIEMKADALFSDAAEAVFDAFILPGGPGTENLRKSPEVIERLRRQKAEGRLICAICAAPTVLVEAEVLDPDQHVTCYPSCVMDLDRPCADAPVVADGAVITGQAPGAATLFGLVVLQALAGELVARKVARGMVTDVL